MTRCVSTAVYWTLVAATAISAPAIASAQSATPSLKRLSLDDLMKIEVTSVSKKEQKLSEAPSAIFVLTQDDLTRAGVTTIAEALRLVPGLEVARIDANKWAISARGFNGRFADKMLVLIDGRSVYTPLFSGVYWDVQDTLLADIDRIEVIRGPGATLWGANAVNGVINIITKPTRETYGALVSVKSGVDERAVLEARYGGPLGGRTDYRAFMKYLERGPFADLTGTDVGDKSDLFRAGVRLDHAPTPNDRLQIGAESYRGESGTDYGPGSIVPFFDAFSVARAEVEGSHLIGRWSRALAPRSDVSVQAYWDFTGRRDPLLNERRHTADVEFQHHTATLARQDIVWGSGFRVTRDRILGSPAIYFSNPARSDELFNAFAQNEVTIVPDRLRVTGGLKVEHNSYTGWELQPDARVLFVVDRRQTLWAAFSRAVRTPSRAETDVTILSAPAPSPFGVPVVTSLRGSPTFISETLRANELGYRFQPTTAWSFDVAVFANQYDHLRTFEPEVPELTFTPDGPVAIAPARFDNLMAGDTRGVEVVARWQPRTAWRVDGTYTFLDVALRHHPASADTYAIVVEDASPRHQARLRSGVTLGRGLGLDGSIAWVGPIDHLALPRYTLADLRLAWHAGSDVTLEVGGRNLFNARHQEFGSTLGEVPSATRRSVFVGIGWQF